MQSGNKETPVIQFQNVFRTYEMGDHVLNALDGVDVDISRNEYVAIVGASGSGKSTMMNIIGCLDRVTKGDYLLNGTNVGDMSEVERARCDLVEQYRAGTGTQPGNRFRIPEF